MYQLELGPIEENIVTQSANMGRSKPQAVAEKPEPLPGNTLYQQAFFDLDGERQIGMSIGRIPWSAVQHYAEVYDFTQAQCAALHYLIGRMDAANLKHIGANMKERK